jgi:hypothetical protein
MILKELKKQIKELLTTRLTSFKQKKGNEFVRKGSYGLDFIGFGITEHYPNFKIGFYLGQRMEIIEKLFNEILPEFTEFPDSTVTIGLYGDYIFEDQNEFIIKDESDVIDWIETLVTYLSTTGLHFFDDYNDLDSLNFLFNSTPEKILKYHDRIDTRACKGIIIAKLVENTEYNQLISSYRKTLENHFFKENFEKVVEFLSCYSKEELYTIGQ